MCKSTMLSSLFEVWIRIEILNMISLVMSCDILDQSLLVAYATH